MELRSQRRTARRGCSFLPASFGRWHMPPGTRGEPVPAESVTRVLPVSAVPQYSCSTGPSQTTTLARVSKCGSAIRRGSVPSSVEKRDGSSTVPRSPRDTTPRRWTRDVRATDLRPVDAIAGRASLETTCPPRKDAGASYAPSRRCYSRRPPPRQSRCRGPWRRVRVRTHHCNDDQAAGANTSRACVVHARTLQVLNRDAPPRLQLCRSSSSASSRQTRASRPRDRHR